MGPMYATVDMQSTAEEKATSGAEDQPLGGSVLDMRSLRARHMHAERDFHMKFKGSVSVSWRMIIFLCGRDRCELNAYCTKITNKKGKTF